MDDDFGIPPTLHDRRVETSSPARGPKGHFRLSEGKEKDKGDLLGTLVEFAYAEYGSALEMLAAAKRAKSPKIKLGYIRHASDEYRHTALIFKVYGEAGKTINWTGHVRFQPTGENFTYV